MKKAEKDECAKCTHLTIQQGILQCNARMNHALARRIEELFEEEKYEEAANTCGKFINKNVPL